MQVLTQNEQGKRAALSPTLYYLPHCEGGLCSNVLRANVGSLGNIAILGNSFRSYYEQWSWKDEAAKARRCETAGDRHVTYSQGAKEPALHPVSCGLTVNPCIVPSKRARPTRMQCAHSAMPSTWCQEEQCLAQQSQVPIPEVRLLPRMSVLGVDGSGKTRTRFPTWCPGMQP